MGENDDKKLKFSLFKCIWIEIISLFDNKSSILKYLNSSTAKIEYYKSANRFKINFLPNSMCKLTFKEFNIINLPRNEKFGVICL